MTLDKQLKTPIKVHYHGSTEDDEGFCGAPVLSGGSYNIGIVTCEDCLKQLKALGDDAYERWKELEKEKK